MTAAAQMFFNCPYPEQSSITSGAPSLITSAETSAPTMRVAGL